MSYNFKNKEIYKTDLQRVMWIYLFVFLCHDYFKGNENTCMVFMLVVSAKMKT